MHYEHVLGTSLELQVTATRVSAARRAEQAVLAEVDRLSAVLSGYTPESELARWQATRGEAVPVSAELAEVLEAGEAWRVRTGGAFNAAAVSLVERLRDGGAQAAPFAGAPRTRDTVDTRAIGDRVRALGGPLWAVDQTRGLATRLTDLPVSLDAIAKGYIVDRAAARASATDGVVDVLLNVGGDLRHVGNRAFTVGVADPRAPAENAPLLAAVRLRGEALATSGGYRRGFRMGGRHVSHIVDPRTGRPADRVLSASVLAPDCATADALSTAFSVLDLAESVALADALPGVGCLLVGADGAITANAFWRSRTVPVSGTDARARADGPRDSTPGSEILHTVNAA
ncbi:hypothetical protein tb265_29830 [Gemmatimonadetes bacterium T265]|nr:hypothetical protein tb265_29830 [Gemmatimonadetes bacterium T265]